MISACVDCKKMMTTTSRTKRNQNYPTMSNTTMSFWDNHNKAYPDAMHGFVIIYRVCIYMLGIIMLMTSKGNDKWGIIEGGNHNVILGVGG